MTFLSDDVIWKTTLLLLSLSSLVSLNTFRWITDKSTNPKDSRSRTILELSVRLKCEEKRGFGFTSTEI